MGNNIEKRLFEHVELFCIWR